MGAIFAYGISVLIILHFYPLLEFKYKIVMSSAMFCLVFVAIEFVRTNLPTIYTLVYEKRKMYSFDNKKLSQKVVKVYATFQRVVNEVGPRGPFLIEFRWGYMFDCLGGHLLEGPVIEHRLIASLWEKIRLEKRQLRIPNEYGYGIGKITESSINEIRGALISEKIIKLEGRTRVDELEGPDL